MDISVFSAVLLALVTYRIVSPVVDLLNPLAAGTRKAGHSASWGSHLGVIRGRRSTDNPIHEAETRSPMPKKVNSK